MFEDEKAEMEEEIAEAMQAMTRQLGPMMIGVMKSILGIFEDEELGNKMVWLQATQSGKMREALIENGFTREEAVAIISNQGSVLASALGSLNSINHK